MAELEEEAPRGEEGFGTNPLKLPQGVPRRGLRLRLPPRFRQRPRPCQRWVVSIRSSASTFFRECFDAPRRRRRPPASPLYEV